MAKIYNQNKKGYTPLEVVIVLILMSLFIGFLYYKYNQLSMEAKKIVCQYDKKNLTFAVKLYKIKYGKFPKNLNELSKRKLLEINSTPIISKKSFFKGNKLIDPFGNPYIYDNLTGKIYFSKETKKYFNN